MKLTPLNSSIVVLAQSHNPTILHPAFLLGQKIVPADWDIAEPPVCTPAISVVKYVPNVVFTCEQSKLMILDNAPRQDTRIPELAANYVRTLPHVAYTAVGINFACYIECMNPEKWIVDRFLKTGPGNDENLVLKAAGLKLVYAFEKSVLNISFDPGIIQIKIADAEEKRTGVVLNGNYDTQIPTEKSADATLAAVSRYLACAADFRSRAQVIFSLES